MGVSFCRTLGSLGAEVLVPFTDIPLEGIRYSFDDASWLPREEAVCQGPVKASLFLRRQEDRILVEGEVEARFLLHCDRCLDAYEEPARLEFSLEIEHADQGGLEREHACRADEMDTMFTREPVVDVGDILRQQVLLGLPVKRLCAASCRGLCSGCGVNLNRETCHCAAQGKDTPFHVLKKLLDR